MGDHAAVGNSVRVVPDGVRAFGNTALEAADDVARAGAVDLQENISALSPALGLIGGDFLAAFAAAQSEHTRAVALLSVAYASSGTAAHETATGYETVVAEQTAALENAAVYLPGSAQ
ncbi:type VII secretion target [Rhodococcus zopfii]|uniref:type VII secretion target n=1 Tax=Rhodococcus zopfii TaxID=43772 RepID=UPI000933B7E6|nr:type VII secretion target [Rhodococcus zopfii]